MSKPEEMESENSITNPSTTARKPRFKQKAKNGNSRARNYDAFRVRVGKKIDADYRAQRAAKFTSKLPSDLSTLSLKTLSAFIYFQTRYAYSQTSTVLNIRLRIVDFWITLSLLRSIQKFGLFDLLLATCYIVAIRPA